mgnify:CR=1 FL=1
MAATKKKSAENEGLLPQKRKSKYRQDILWSQKSFYGLFWLFLSYF